MSYPVNRCGVGVMHAVSVFYRPSWVGQCTLLRIGFLYQSIIRSNPILFFQIVKMKYTEENSELFKGFIISYVHMNKIVRDLKNKTRYVHKNRFCTSSNNKTLVWFLCLTTYQPSLVILCQRYPFETEVMLRGSLNKFPDFFFRMGTFIYSTHMKL